MFKEHESYLEDNADKSDKSKENKHGHHFRGVFNIPVVPPWTLDININFYQLFPPLRITFVLRAAKFLIFCQSFVMLFTTER